MSNTSNNTSNITTPDTKSQCYYKEDLNSIFLPFIPCEQQWATWLRGLIYLLLLAYFFIGVAIVSDIFMSSIEFIVSQSKTIPYEIGEDEKRKTVDVEIRVWNPTVANLTLMALGSSAPEILLSVIEIIGNNFKSGDLGPGTIVGSAAFNLLFISAACVMFVPHGGTRRIEIYTVFLITSIFSLFAYIWLLLILDYITPGVVDIWEAVITLMCFPILVLIAWWADNDFCINRKKALRKSLVMKADEMKQALGLASVAPSSQLLQSDEHPLYVNGQINPLALMEFYKDIRDNADVTDEEAASLIATKLIETKRHSRLWYRMGACRALVGSAKIQPTLNEKLQTVYNVLNEKGGKHLKMLDLSTDVYRKKAIIEFQAASFSVPEDIGIIKITILRGGRADNEVTVHVNSIEGTAKEVSDYIKVDTDVVFEPFVYQRQIEVEIVDDNQYEPDESFFLRLTLPSSPKQEDVIIGNCATMEVVILDNDKPGVLSFAKRGLLVSETSRQVAVEVQRTDGADGNVAVQWKTVPDPVAGRKHPNIMQGKLTFHHGERSKFIHVPLFQENNEESDHETFDVILLPTGLEGGATLGRMTKTSITISDDASYQETVTKVVEMAAAEMDIIGYTTFKQQIEQAFSVTGEDDDGDGEGGPPSPFQYYMHFLCFPWKVLFAFIPPPVYLGGWLCFITSLALIGILTAIIGDLAAIFGCIVGLKPTITAITFVALGTSLPDTFASMAAAKQDKSADNAIGNVTGSNSVNVFLGLGIPWTIASIVHAANKRPFVVESKDLGFSVLVYSVVAVIALLFLTVRRNMALFGKAELGGPRGPKIGSAIFLLILWLIYIALSSMNAYTDWFSAFHKERKH